MAELLGKASRSGYGHLAGRRLSRPARSSRHPAPRPSASRRAPRQQQGGACPPQVAVPARRVVRTRSCTERSIGPPAVPAPTSSSPPSSSGSRSTQAPWRRVAAWPFRCGMPEGPRPRRRRPLRRGPVRSDDPDRPVPRRCPTTTPRSCRCAAVPRRRRGGTLALRRVPARRCPGPCAGRRRRCRPMRVAFSQPVGNRAHGDHPRRRGRLCGRQPDRPGRVHRRAAPRAGRRPRCRPRGARPAPRRGRPRGAGAADDAGRRARRRGHRRDAGS